MGTILPASETNDSPIGPCPDHYITAGQYAERHGLTRRYIRLLCKRGRISGAVKCPPESPKHHEPIWKMAPDAERLPPSEDDRSYWRERWHRTGATERQRERRRRIREEGN